MVWRTEQRKRSKQGQKLNIDIILCSVTAHGVHMIRQYVTKESSLGSKSIIFENCVKLNSKLQTLDVSFLSTDYELWGHSKAVFLFHGPNMPLDCVIPMLRVIIIIIGHLGGIY